VSAHAFDANASRHLVQAELLAADPRVADAADWLRSTSCVLSAAPAASGTSTHRLTPFRMPACSIDVTSTAAFAP
jgi:hypothetical protein